MTTDNNPPEEQDPRRTSRASGAEESLTVCIAANKFISLLKKKVRQKNIYQRTPRIDEGYQPPSYEHSEEDSKLILSALKKNFFLRARSKDELRRLAKSFEECSHKRGDQFINQGDPGDYFYVMRSGGVRFVVNGLTVSKTTNSGVSFGEMALLFTSPRAASVIATEDSNFFRVGQRDFRAIMQRQTQAAVDLKFKLLGGVNFLKAVADQDLKKLSAAMTPHLFGPNTLLAKKGDAGQQFWIIHEGQVKMTDVELGSTKYQDQTLVSGDHFGSQALARDEPREANFTSLTAGVAFTIDRKTFEKVLGSMSALVVKAEDARKLGGIEFFRQAKLDAAQLAILANLITHKAFQKDHSIMQKGRKIKPALYIVREGEIQVEAPDGSRVLVKSGGHFGSELLNTAEGQIRSTIESPLTARAESTCVCGVLTLRDCRTLFETDDDENDEEEQQEVAAVPAPSKEKKKEKHEKKKREEKVEMPASVGGFNRHLVLGEGTFGQVWLVSSKETSSGGKPRPLALKIQSKFDLIEECQAMAAMREKELMQELQHPFIIKLFGTYQDDDFLYCVLDFLQGGELFSVIQAHEKNDYKLPEAHAKFYALGICDALTFMHRSRIAYRDIKSENVMIDEKGYPVLVDLGFAKKVGFDKTYTFCGTPRYLAPEIIMSQGHTISADHWSLGILIYELLMGRNPFEVDGADEMVLIFQCISHEPHARPYGVSADAVDIIDSLLVKDPVMRLGSMHRGETEVLQHPWFDDLDLCKMRRRKIKAPWIPTIKDPLDASNFDDWSELEDKKKRNYPQLSDKEQREFKGY